jgi:hypothetical protein
LIPCLFLDHPNREERGKREGEKRLTTKEEKVHEGKMDGERIRSGGRNGGMPGIQWANLIGRHGQSREKSEAGILLETASPVGFWARSFHQRGEKSGRFRNWISHRRFFPSCTFSSFVVNLFSIPVLSCPVLKTLSLFVKSCQKSTAQTFPSSDTP